MAHMMMEDRSRYNYNGENKITDGANVKPITNLLNEVTCNDKQTTRAIVNMFVL